MHSVAWLMITRPFGPSNHWPHYAYHGYALEFLSKLGPSGLAYPVIQVHEYISGLVFHFLELPSVANAPSVTRK